jgi:hypothetical protein
VKGLETVLLALLYIGLSLGNMKSPQIVVILLLSLLGLQLCGLCLWSLYRREPLVIGLAHQEWSIQSRAIKTAVFLSTTLVMALFWYLAIRRPIAFYLLLAGFLFSLAPACLFFSVNRFRNPPGSIDLTFILLLVLGVFSLRQAMKQKKLPTH